MSIGCRIKESNLNTLCICFLTFKKNPIVKHLLTLCLLANFAFVSSAVSFFFFQINFLSKDSFSNRSTIRESNSLDPGQV